MLGNRYNPNNDEALQKELQHGFNRMSVLCFDIEHLTGKESIELIRAKAATKPGLFTGRLFHPNQRSCHSMIVSLSSLQTTWAVCFSFVPFGATT